MESSTSVVGLFDSDLSHCNVPNDLLGFYFLFIPACVLIGGCVSAELDALIRA